MVVACCCATCVSETLAIACALAHEAHLAESGSSESAARNTQLTATLFQRLAENIRAAALCMGTVLPAAEGHSPLLARGRAILRQQRGSGSMLRDLPWLYRHAAGVDITLPAVVDTICYGLVQTCNDTGKAKVRESNDWLL